MNTKITITRDEFRTTVRGLLAELDEEQLENGTDALFVGLESLKNAVLMTIVEKRLFDNKEDK